MLNLHLMMQIYVRWQYVNNGERFASFTHREIFTPVMAVSGSFSGQGETRIYLILE